MRELAYIQQIKNLSPIPGADKIEKAEILGWELVVKTKEFKPGDLCVYCEIDSILPELPPFEFLRSKKFRIKTIKLKGQISQGIAFPLSVIKEVDPSFDLTTAKVGQDLTDVLRITKYDPEALLDEDTKEETSPQKRSWLSKKLSYYKWKLFGFKPAKGKNFPSDIPKTDEIRVQNMGSALERHESELMYITEKCEGTSSTFIFRKRGNWLASLFGKNYTFEVCSRNRVVYSSDNGGDCNHHIFQVAQKYNLQERMKKLNRNLAIQAETIGPKIQANIYKLPELDLRVFLMYDLDKQEYLNYDEMVSIAKTLELPLVPVLATHVPLVNDVKYYVELSKGKSQINSNVLREGIVIRSMKINFSFKSINPEYLLKEQL